MQKIADLGGAEKAIAQGYYQKLSRENAYSYQNEIDQGKRKIVGLNCFNRPEEEIRIEAFKSDPDLYAQRIRLLRDLRKNRDNQAVAACLKRLREAARSDQNTVPALIECVEQYATMGEIFDVLRGVFGTFEEGFELL